MKPSDFYELKRLIHLDKLARLKQQRTAEYQATVCQGKQQFGSFEEAQRNGINWHFLQAYRCNVCGHWHVGNKPRDKLLKLKLMKAKREERQG